MMSAALFLSIPVNISLPHPVCSQYMCCEGAAGLVCGRACRARGAHGGAGADRRAAARAARPARRAAARRRGGAGAKPCSKSHRVRAEPRAPARQPRLSGHGRAAHAEPACDARPAPRSGRRRGGWRWGIRRRVSALRPSGRVPRARRGGGAVRPRPRSQRCGCGRGRGGRRRQPMRSARDAAQARQRVRRGSRRRRRPRA